MNANLLRLAQRLQIKSEFQTTNDFDHSMKSTRVAANRRIRVSIISISNAAILIAMLSYGLGTSQAQDYYPSSTQLQRPPIIQYVGQSQQESAMGRSSILESTDVPIVQSPENGAGVDPAPAAVDQAKEDEKKKKKAAALKKKVGSAYKGCFFDNDFSYLLDDSYNDWHLGEYLKRQCLPHGGWYSIGGQYRSRAQGEQNMRGLGLTGVDDKFILQRTRIYGDFQFTPRLRVYAEMLDGASIYENFGPRPIDVNRTEMQNMFVDAKLLDGQYGSLTARVGRQELLFGAQRAVSPLDWANIRRTFEGARMMWKKNDLSIDGFWMNPMRVDDDSFDSPDRDQEFMGIYTSYGGRKDQKIDTYFLRYLNGRGANNFKYNTIGARWQGSRCDYLWDFETAYQFGQNTDGSDHSAGMVTMGLGRKLSNRSWQPTLWAYYDYASGDDATGAGNGFNHNFPLSHKYLGFMDFYGRSNIEDVNMLFTVQPTKKLKFLMWYHYFFLATKSDSPYNVNMSAFNGGNTPGSASLGHEIDFVATYQLNTRTRLLGGFSQFYSGEYYHTTAGVPYNGNANFFYTQWAVDF